MDTDPNAPPLNPLPWIVWVLILPLIAAEVAVGLGASGLAGGPAAVGWRLDGMERFAFLPGLLRDGWESGLWRAEAFWRMFSYPLIHWSFTHALIAIVMLLALGKWVGEVFRPWAVVAVVAAGSVAGALAYAVVPVADAPLAGAYPAVYGLIGAFTYVLWVRLIAQGGPQHRAFILIGFLMGSQLLLGALFGGGWFWVAELAGFGAGFLVSFVVSPGGFGRVMARLRQR